MQSNLAYVCMYHIDAPTCVSFELDMYQFSPIITHVFLVAILNCKHRQTPLNEIPVSV